MMDENNSNLLVKQPLKSQPTSLLTLPRKCDIPTNGTRPLIIRANTQRGNSATSTREKTNAGAVPRHIVPSRSGSLNREVPKIDLAPSLNSSSKPTSFASALRPKPSFSAVPKRKEPALHTRPVTSTDRSSSSKVPSTGLSRTWTPSIKSESTSTAIAPKRAGASFQPNGKLQHSSVKSMGCHTYSEPVLKPRPLIRQTRPATAATISTGCKSFADRLGAKKKAPTHTLDSKLSRTAKAETASAVEGPPSFSLTGPSKPRPLCRPTSPFPHHENLSELTTRFGPNNGNPHASLLTTRLHLRSECLVQKSRSNSRQVSSSLVSSAPSSPNPRNQSDEQSTAWRGRGLVVDEDIMPLPRTARRERSILESPEHLPSFLGPDDLLIENVCSPSLSPSSGNSTRSPELLSSKDVAASEGAGLDPIEVRADSISDIAGISPREKPRKAAVIHSPEVSCHATNVGDRKTIDQPESSSKGLANSRLSTKVRTPNTLVILQTPYTNGYSTSKRFNVFKTPQKNLNFSAIGGSSRHACGSLSRFNRSPLRRPCGSLLTSAIVMGNELVVERVILKSDEEVNGLLTIPCKYRPFFKISAEAESSDAANLAWYRLYSPPLTLAAKLGKARVVKKLVELGAETTKLDGGGRSLLHSLFLPLPDDILACRTSGEDPLAQDQYHPESKKHLQNAPETSQADNDLSRRVAAPLDLSMSTPIVPSHTRSSSPTCLTWATPFGSNGRYSLVTPRIAFLDKKELDKLGNQRVSLCETLLAPENDSISLLDDMSRIVESLCSNGISLELVDRNGQVATSYARKWLHQAAHELQDTSRVTLRQQLAASAVRAAALTLLAHEDRLRSTLLAPLFTSFPIKGFNKLDQLTSQCGDHSAGWRAEGRRRNTANKPCNDLTISKNLTAARRGRRAPLVKRGNDEDLTQLIQLAHKNSGNSAFLCIWEFLGASFVDAKN